MKDSHANASAVYIQLTSEFASMPKAVQMHPHLGCDWQVLVDVPGKSHYYIIDVDLMFQTGCQTDKNLPRGEEKFEELVAAVAFGLQSKLLVCLTKGAFAEVSSWFPWLDFLVTLMGLSRLFYTGRLLYVHDAIFHNSCVNMNPNDLTCGRVVNAHIETLFLIPRLQIPMSRESHDTSTTKSLSMAAVISQPHLVFRLVCMS